MPVVHTRRPHLPTLIPSVSRYLAQIVHLAVIVYCYLPVALVSHAVIGNTQ